MISPFRSDLQAWALGEYARWAIDRNSEWYWVVLRPIPAVPTVVFVFLVFVLQPNLLGRLYMWDDARISLIVTPRRGAYRHAAVSLAILLVTFSGLVFLQLGQLEDGLVAFALILALLVSSANLIWPLSTMRRMRGFESPIDHYASAFVRWRFRPGSNGSGETYWSALLAEARTRGWYIGLIANTDEMAEKYLLWGMEWDNEHDAEGRRLVYDGKAKARDDMAGPTI